MIVEDDHNMDGCTNAVAIQMDGMLVDHNASGHTDTVGEPVFGVQ